MANYLGNWAVIDIETSGIRPEDDSIIDVGYLQFEGTQLIRKYSSLVRFPMSPLHHENYGKFIEKLTGISREMLNNSPLWEEVLPEVKELQDHYLIAHNSDFEHSFLADWLGLPAAPSQESPGFIDSIFYLSLLHPEKTALNLEEFITSYGLRDGEIHRGFEDSLDLLKVMILATLKTKKDSAQSQLIKELFFKYHLQDWWFAHFFNLSREELYEIADQIEFCPDEFLDNLVPETIEESLNDDDLSLKFDGKSIQKLLTDEKRLQEFLPYYQFRNGQLELSKRTGQSLKNNTHALIQAPTGTGKTLGYLIPSALYAIEEKSPVLVATGTKALQHQAMDKDVPLLKKVLGRQGHNLKVSQLIGSNNHLCELLFRHETEEDSLLLSSAEFDQKFSQIYLDLIFSTEELTKLRGDLPYVLKKKLGHLEEKEKQWAVDYKSCSGRNCPYKNNCSYVQGLKEARESDIIIGNHALLFSWPKSIPRPQKIIIDEAHKIEHETTSACSLEVSQTQLKQIENSLKTMQGIGALFYLLAQHESSPGESTPLINKIRTDVTSYAEMLSDQLTPLEGLVEKYVKKMPRYSSIYWNELPFKKELVERDALGKRILQHFESIQNIFQIIYNALLPYATQFEGREFNEEAKTIAKTRFETFFSHLDEVLESIKTFLGSEEQSEFPQTHSLKYHEEFGFIFNNSPVNIGKIIHDYLLSPSESVVFTSATLGDAKGEHGPKGVEWFTGYSYLEPERRFQKGLFLPSVYDYEKRTKVFLVDDTPPLWEQHFVDKTLEEICQVTEEIKGRSLFLFSAKVRFEKAREILLQKFEGKFPIFIQGMGNNIVEEFKKTENGILLGMESFGEGIDIPGESLQFIFIDKIPDLRMDLVINDRREFFDKNIGNEFSDYYLANRTRALHQKLGRLLRRDNDFGGVIITDGRAKRWKGNTMEKFNKQMAPYKIHRSSLKDACSEVTAFIKSMQ